VGKRGFRRKEKWPHEIWKLKREDFSNYIATAEYSTTEKKKIRRWEWGGNGYDQRGDSIRASPQDVGAQIEGNGRRIRGINQTPPGWSLPGKSFGCINPVRELKI